MKSLRSLKIIFSPDPGRKGTFREDLYEVPQIGVLSVWEMSLKVMHQNQESKEHVKLSL